MEITQDVKKNILQSLMKGRPGIQEKIVTAEKENQTLVL